MTKVCGWCGQPLNHWGKPQEGMETCEDAYGNPCQKELNQQSQLAYEAEMRIEEMNHPDYINEGAEVNE